MHCASILLARAAKIYVAQQSWDYLPSLQATITVVVDDELDLVENSLPSDKPLVVQRKSSEHFSLKLHPRAIGQLAITITAVGDRGQRDVVRKFLLVKVSVIVITYTWN